jgi:hypothetical protein
MRVSQQHRVCLCDIILAAPIVPPKVPIERLGRHVLAELDAKVHDDD